MNREQGMGSDEQGAMNKEQGMGSDEQGLVNEQMCSLDGDSFLDFLFCDILFI